MPKSTRNGQNLRRLWCHECLIGKPSCWKIGRFQRLTLVVGWLDTFWVRRSWHPRRRHAAIFLPPPPHSASPCGSWKIDLTERWEYQDPRVLGPSRFQTLPLTWCVVSLMCLTKEKLPFWCIPECEISPGNRKLDLAICKMLALDQQLEKADAVNKSWPDLLNSSGVWLRRCALWGRAKFADHLVSISHSIDLEHGSWKSGLSPIFDWLWPRGRLWWQRHLFDSASLRPALDHLSGNFYVQGLSRGGG